MGLLQQAEVPTRARVGSRCRYTRTPGRAHTTTDLHTHTCTLAACTPLACAQLARLRTGILAHLPQTHLLRCVLRVPLGEKGLEVGVVEEVAHQRNRRRQRDSVVEPVAVVEVMVVVIFVVVVVVGGVIAAAAAAAARQ